MNEYVLNKKEQMEFLAVAYLVTAGFLYLFYKSLAISLVGGLLGIFMEDEYRSYLFRKRKKFMLLQFRDLMYSISSSVATGRYMFEALKEGEEYLKMIYKEDSPLVKELHYINNTIYENHGKEDEVLLEFAERSQLEDISNFVDVYITARTTGGNLQQIVSDTSVAITEKMQIQKEIETLMAQKQFEARIVSLIPILILLFLNIFSPEYLLPMYSTIAGRMIMTASVIGFVIAMKWMIKLTEV